jgi:hypothetical protein
MQLEKNNYIAGMVKRITLKKVDAPSGCTINTSGTLIVDNESEYEIHSDDERCDEDGYSSEGMFDYESCATSDAEDTYEPQKTYTFSPAKINMTEYDGEEELEEETDFKPVKKKCK